MTDEAPPSSSSRARIITALAFCTAPVFANACGLWFVYTPSVPVGLYRRYSIEDRPLARGDFVCLDGSRSSAPPAISTAAQLGLVPRSWIEGESLTKQIIGLPGERVDYLPGPDGGQVVLEGHILSGSTIRNLCSTECLPRTSYPVELASDEYWLGSKHPQGFDSRYFGPARRNALSCRAEPLWTW